MRCDQLCTLKLIVRNKLLGLTCGHDVNEPCIDSYDDDDDDDNLIFLRAYWTEVGFKIPKTPDRISPLSEEDEEEDDSVAFKSYN